MEKKTLLESPGRDAKDAQETNGEDPEAASALDAKSLEHWRPQQSWAAWMAIKKNKVSRLVAAVTGHSFVAGLLERLSAAAFAAKPLSAAAVIHQIYSSGHPWWAGMALFFNILPYLALAATFMRGEDYRKAFADAFGIPVYLPGALMFLDYKIVVKELLGMRRSPAEDTYIKLCRMFHSAFGSVLWTFFQVWIAIRQPYFDHQVVNPVLLPVNIALAMHTLYSSWDYLKTYANIATGGNVSDFLEMHLILGRGAAPPSLLQRLRSRAVVDVDDDLSKLEIMGLRSIFLAIKSSLALQECNFRSTGIDAWYLTRTEECNRTKNSNFKPGSFWKHCMRDLVMNRERLQLVSFSPALEIPVNPDHYDYPAALSVVVKSGDQEVHKGFEPTPFLTAVQANSFDRCVGEGKEREIPTSKDRILAVRLDHWRALAGFIARDPNCAAREPDLLNFAAMEGALCCTELLIHCKADPTVPGEDGHLPAVRAAAGGKADVLKMLLAAGASVNAMQTEVAHKFKFNPVYACAHSDSEACAKLLVEARADLNMEMRYKERPLHASAQHHAVKVTRVLLAARADVNALQGNLESPLHYAAREGATELCRALLQARADPSLLDKKNQTPLAKAKGRNQEDCIELLAEAESRNEADTSEETSLESMLQP